MQCSLIASNLLTVRCLFRSENYIFGKFDAFCKRLEKLDDMLMAMENLSGLQKIKIEVCPYSYSMSVDKRFCTKLKEIYVLGHWNDRDPIPNYGGHSKEEDVRSFRSSQGRGKLMQ